MSSLILPNDFNNTPPIDLSMGIPIGGAMPPVMTEEQLTELLNPTFEIKVKYLDGMPELEKIEQGD